MNQKPQVCGECLQLALFPCVEDYSAEVEHDGRTYLITVPGLTVLRCRACNNVVLDDDADERLSNSLRDAAGLLKPAEIRAMRHAAGLTQRELARRLRIAEATLSRWETGAQIQQPGMDQHIRNFFKLYEIWQRAATSPSRPVNNALTGSGIHWAAVGPPPVGPRKSVDAHNVTPAISGCSTKTYTEIAA